MALTVNVVGALSVVVLKPHPHDAFLHERILNGFSAVSPNIVAIPAGRLSQDNLERLDDLLDREEQLRHRRMKTLRHLQAFVSKGTMQTLVVCAPPTELRNIAGQILTKWRGHSRDFESMLYVSPAAWAAQIAIMLNVQLEYEDLASKIALATLGRHLTLRLTLSEEGAADTNVGPILVQEMLAAGLGPLADALLQLTILRSAGISVDLSGSEFLMAPLDPPAPIPDPDLAEVRPDPRPAPTAFIN